MDNKKYLTGREPYNQSRADEIELFEAAGRSIGGPRLSAAHVPVNYVLVDDVIRLLLKVSDI